MKSGSHKIKDKFRKLTGDYDSSAKVYKSIEECLRYLSKKGIILWYIQNKEYIYHNIDNILELHKELFRHDLEESMQYNVKYSHIMNEVTFDLSKAQFLNTGFLSRELLQCLWLSFKLNGNELEGMIELIKANNHCFEDTTDDDSSYVPHSDRLLRFPWFIKTPALSKSFWDFYWTKQVPEGCLEFQYVYTFFRRIPSTLYERISVRLQKILGEYGYVRKDWINGVYVQKGNVRLLIQRLKDNKDDPQLVVSIRAPLSDLLYLWNICIDSYKVVVNDLVNQSAVVTFNKIFVCPHCILAGRTSETAHLLPLGDVMQNQSTDTSDVLCPKTDILGQTKRTIPGAFWRPVLSGIYIYARSYIRHSSFPCYEGVVRRSRGLVQEQHKTLKLHVCSHLWQI